MPGRQEPRPRVGVEAGRAEAHELRPSQVLWAIQSAADRSQQKVSVTFPFYRNPSACTSVRARHLFDDRLNDVADRLDAAARAADVYPLCTRPEIVDLDDKRRKSARP